MFKVIVVRPDIYNDFISPTSELRRLGRFWISGSLENIERKALSEGDFGCRRATLTECIVALTTASMALAWVVSLF